MLTVIGDCHGKYKQYYNIASKADYSVVAGDFGFASMWNNLQYSGLSAEDHKVIAGNHDDYDFAPNCPNYLGDYGLTTIGEVEFFFVRGGISIDRVYRVGEELSGSPKTWWSQEELPFSDMLECLKAYRKAKPDIVITHVPAAEFSCHLAANDNILQRYKFHKGFKEAHQLLGDEMLKIHRPKLWVSGHFHVSKTMLIKGTEFVSLGELETYGI